MARNAATTGEPKNIAGHNIDKSGWFRYLKRNTYITAQKMPKYVPYFMALCKNPLEFSCFISFFFLEAV
jgi:hypothetical protein